MSNVTFKDKLLASFANPVYNTITLATAVARYKVSPTTVRKAVRELRLEGKAIYTNEKTLDTGRKIKFYRLGKPSGSFKRHMRAGRTELALAALERRW